MRSLALALSVAILSLAGAAHAKTVPASDLKKQILAGTPVKVNPSSAPNSTWTQVSAAIRFKPAVFRKITLQKATSTDTGSWAYLLKQPAPKTAEKPGAMVKPATAYVISESIMGPQMAKVSLSGN